MLAVHRLLDRWAGFVAEAEDGWLRPVLGRWDARFRAATVPWPGHEEDARRWRGRIPRLLAAEPGEPLYRGRPDGWGMMPFRRPDGVRIER